MKLLVTFFMNEDTRDNIMYNMREEYYYLIKLKIYMRLQLYKLFGYYKHYQQLQLWLKLYIFM